MAGDRSGGTVTALAVGAHPDDIEFMMAGTLLLLKEKGADIHMWSLANGCCGSADRGRKELIEIRWREARESALEAGAHLHPPLVDDMAVVYGTRLLARVTAVLRRVKPDILLVPSPEEYMEDHSCTSRLLVSAAFARGMVNFPTEPAVEPWTGDTVIYHAAPYGLRDGLRRLVQPGQFVDIQPVLPVKRAMLEKHRSQRDWLESSQGVGSYVGHMEEMCRSLGRMSGRFAYAEGWRRHSHLGFCARESDMLAELLGDACYVVPDYERTLG